MTGFDRIGRRLAAAGLALLALVSTALAQAPERVTVRSADHPDFSRAVFDFTRTIDYRAAVDGGRLTVHFDRPFTPLFGPLADRPLDRLAAPSASVGDGGMVVQFTVPAGASVRHFRSGTRVVIDAVVATAPAEPTPTPAPTPAPAAPAANVEERPPPSAAGTLAVQVREVDNGVVLGFPWAEPVAAAMFVRAGHLWVIFDRPASLDHRALGRAGNTVADRIRSAEPREHPDATIWRYRVRPNQSLVAARRGTHWQVTLQDQLGYPSEPLEVSRRIVAGGISQLFIGAEELGAHLRVTDPAVGDRLSIVPIADPGRGMAERRRYAQFVLLATAQGVAVQPVSDQVTVSRFTDGITIDGKAGLALSRSALDRRVSIGDAVLAPDEPTRLIDFAAWRLPEVGLFPTARERLVLALGASPHDRRNPARWDLARFYLAHGMAAHTLGLLTLMAEEDAGLENSAEFRAVRGVALHMLGRPAEALADLKHHDLYSEADAQLWRALAAEAVGRHEEALVAYRRGNDALAEVEPPQRAAFQLAAARAALALDQLDVMAAQLDALDTYPLARRQADEAALLRGRYAELRDDGAAAVTYYDAVAKSPWRRLAVEARFARVQHDREHGRMTPPQAIEALEKLRYAWRGDGFELRLLETLGNLYIDQGDYRTGLETLRQAAANFPKSDRTRAIAARMAEVFRDLFLGEAVGALPPIAAVALYHDFQELTPLGPDGDTMIRRLADRLVAVDLLDRAAGLLEHQVRYRLEGAAQAQIAVRLAKIYLLDGRADEALGIMRATRQDVLPREVERERRLVEVRALIVVKRWEEADVLLEADRSGAADRLRGDIYWGAADWPRLIAVTDRLLGKRWQSDAPLSSQERRYLVRQALAYSTLDDRAGLNRLRARYGVLMREGLLSHAFDILTSEEDRSADQISELSRKIASVDQLTSFMAAYRAEFVDAGGVGASN